MEVHVVSLDSSRFLTSDTMKEKACRLDLRDAFRASPDAYEALDKYLPFIRTSFKRIKIMSEAPTTTAHLLDKKPAMKAMLAPEERLLVGRSEAADMPSISCRTLDCLVAKKQLPVRRIGTRVLISVSDLRRFARGDHPQRLAG